jgi:hypothetical protein
MSKIAPRQNSSNRLGAALAATVLLAGLALLTGCAGVSSGSSNPAQTSALSFGASTLNFGSVAAGATKTLTVTAQNSGPNSVTINSAAISTQYFSLTAPSLPITVASGQSATISIAFTPNTAATFNATLTVNSSASNSAASVSLAGTGTGTGPTEGSLGLNPSSEGFSSVTVGAQESQTVTLTNSGGASVDISAASISGTGFELSGITPPLTLNASESTTLTVTFAPQTTGLENGTVTITSNGSNPTLTMSLSGTGTAAPTYTVALAWDASTSQSISGYNIYRAVYTTSCGSFAKINSALDAGLTYSDTVVVDGTHYCYATTAVNTSNEESGYSNIVPNVEIPAP